MLKIKWYYRVNFNDNSLVEFCILPVQAGSCEDVARRNDNEVSDLNWAGINEGYLTYQAALARGFSEEQLNNIRLPQETTALLFNTELRQELTEAVNHVNVEIAWDSFSELEKNQIAVYRQQLNDLVIGDVFNPIWPTCPDVLVNFYKNI